MVNEGGGIAVDGQGTVIVTETVQLHDRRNPDWTKQDVEAELAAFIGAPNVIWLPRGLTSDYGGTATNGHVDLLAAFVKPGIVVCHVQPDPSHPDFEVTRENLGILRAAKDASGRELEVVEVLAPTVLEVHGQPAEYTYINHYLANGLALMCGFDDPRDAERPRPSANSCRTAASCSSTPARSSTTAAASTASPSRSRGRPEAGSAEPIESTISLVWSTGWIDV